MPIKSLKAKINNLASGEVLGETEEEIERKKRNSLGQKKAPRKPQKKAPRKPKQAPREKSPKDNFFQRKEDLAEEVNKPAQKTRSTEVSEKKEKTHVKEAISGYEDILIFLGIKEELDTDVDFTSKDLDYIEFGQTAPIGLDYDEVTDFISRTKYTLNKLESAIKQRDKDIVILASEVKKVEEKMAERAQALELERMVGSVSEVEMLNEENMELNIKINELEQRIIDLGSPEEVSQLRKEVEILRAENDMLRQSSNSKENSQEFKMPSLDESSYLNPLPSSEGNKMPDLDNLDSERLKMPSIDEINGSSLKMPKLD